MTRPHFAPLMFVTLLALACADDGAVEGSGTESGTSTGEDSGETESSSGDGDGDPATGDGDGDGDGEPSTGDGDGDPSTGDGDGDGDPTTGDGDGDGDDTLDDLLTLDHVQVKGTHNSYHIEPLLAFDSSHEYTHPPLDVQLEDYGVRAFELDLHRSLIDGELLVYHILVIDEETTCETLVDCLTTIDTWSDAHPEHVPIMVWFEIKDSTGGMPIDDLLQVDQTILDVFEPSEVLTPDFVQGEYGSVREALETEGWPTLGEVRGKVMFMVLNGGHDSVDGYTSGATSLFGRMMFVGSGDYVLPYAAVHKINNPGSDQIALAHAASVLTASNTCGAGQDDDSCFAELEAGLMTGTHNLMDDFLEPGDGAYFLDLPDGNPVRCNEATAPPECSAEALEDL